MTVERFHIQDVATGLYVAAMPCAEPFTPHWPYAASYGLLEAAQRIEQLAAGKPAGYRLLQTESFAFDPS